MAHLQLTLEAPDWLSILAQSEASNFEMEASDWLSILDQSETSKFEMQASDWLLDFFQFFKSAVCLQFSATSVSWT